MEGNTTNRKPHSDTAGYVTERKSKHPRLPGHFVIIDRQNGGDWIDADNRWVVIHANGDKFGCMVSLPSCKAARDVMYHVAGGGDDVDFGQHERPPCLACGAYEPDHVDGCVLAEKR